MKSFLSMAAFFLIILLLIFAPELFAVLRIPSLCANLLSFIRSVIFRL